MKTSIMELKERILSMIQNGGTEDDLFAVIGHIDNEFLEKEKQQIKNAYIIGYSDCHSSSAKNQDLYFKLLYNGKDI